MAKELSREPSKSQSRGVLPKQPEPKSESKMSSPGGGGVYPSAFAQAPGGHVGLTAGRALPIMATESMVNRDKTQNKDHELRALGETDDAAQQPHAGSRTSICSFWFSSFERRRPPLRGRF